MLTFDLQHLLTFHILLTDITFFHLIHLSQVHLHFGLEPQYRYSANTTTWKTSKNLSVIKRINNFLLSMASKRVTKRSIIEIEHPSQEQTLGRTPIQGQTQGHRQGRSASRADTSPNPRGTINEHWNYTGKLIIGKLSDPIKLPGSGLRFNSDKFIGIYRS